MPVEKPLPQVADALTLVDLLELSLLQPWSSNNNTAVNTIPILCSLINIFIAKFQEKVFPAALFLLFKKISN
jgi:hypothetical protein